MRFMLTPARTQRQEEAALGAGAWVLACPGRHTRKHHVAAKFAWPGSGGTVRRVLRFPRHNYVERVGAELLVSLQKSGRNVFKLAVSARCMQIILISLLFFSGERN